MKSNFVSSLLLMVLVAVVATACKDRDAEKKIAQLESRLAELEGKKSPAAISPTPAAPAAEEKPDGPLQQWSFRQWIMILVPSRKAKLWSTRMRLRIPALLR